MAFAGLKKQINKANQYVTEKMGGAEGTKLDLDFMDMERKTDVTVELVEELQNKTKEFLQPNPTARAKMAAVKGISKLSGQAKSNTYPQPEGLLADCMLMYGKKLGEDSVFALALIEMGESLKQMADVKYSLDDNIKQNFLEPLHHLQTKDLKEVMHHRKKLQGRRLDFDCKKRRQAKGSNVTDDEIRSAEDKFAESLHLAQIGMFNLLENDVEQVSQLATFAEGLLDFHAQCTDILKILVETLQEKREEAASRPKGEFVPKTLADLNIETLGDGGSNNGRFVHPNTTNFSRLNSHNSNISNNNSHHHLYGSQQNLSHTNNKSANFSRNRMYGSQQSLSSSIASNSRNGNGTTSSRSITSTAYGNNYTTAGNNNSHNNNNETDVWANAWNSPPPQPQPRAVPPNKLSIHTSSVDYNHSQFNSKKSLFNNDPWTEGIIVKPTHLELDNGSVQARSVNASPLPSPMRSPAKTPAMAKPSGPCCTALYDFEPENPGELGFKENDVIQLLNKVDENWFEGAVNGRTGYFPQSYVNIVVPLP